MKYLNVANPYPSPRDYGLINSYNIIPVVFSILMILIILKKYVSWYSKRTKYIEHRKPNGFKRSEPFYRIHCSIHGYYEDYQHGYKEYFICPKCKSERDEIDES